MKLTPVESSNIRAIGYDATNKRLLVEFRNSGKPSTWAYEDVPADVHRAILGADLSPKDRAKHSIGSTFSKLVRGVYKGSLYRTSDEDPQP